MVGPGVGEGHGQGLDQVGFGGSCGKEFEFYLQGNSGMEMVRRGWFELCLEI